MLAVFGSFLLFTKAKQQQQSSIAKVEKFFFGGGRSKNEMFLIEAIKQTLKLRFALIFHLIGII